MRSNERLESTFMRSSERLDSIEGEYISFFNELDSKTRNFLATSFIFTQS
jgi:hypothetical protein